MGILSFRRQATYLFLFFVMLLVLVPHAGHDSDMSFWVAWTKDIFYHGLGNIYQTPSNSYNPLYHYILWLYSSMFDDVEKLIYYRHMLKAFTLVFDFAGAIWAASLVRERDRRFGLVLLLLFNIGYLYNTVIWIQVDAIYTLFAFGAVVLAVQERPVASMLLFVLSLAAKPQALIFLPPLLLLWAPLWWQRPTRLVQAVVAGAVLMTLVLAPFIWGGDQNDLPRILEINLGAAHFFPYLSMNAYNMWYMVSDQPNLASDVEEVAGLTYRAWGLLMFFGTAVLALLPLLLLAVRNLRRPRLSHADAAAARYADLARVLLSIGLIPLAFAFFNTQMHERYWHAAVLFLAAYGFLRRDYFLYVIVSVAYALNLEGVLQYLQLRKYSVLVFDPRFVAGLFAIAIVVGLVKLYRLTPWRHDWQLIRQAFGRPASLPQPAMPMASSPALGV
jgi:Gpi18-like mannosyltransferase